jgi:SWI/SNF-related matrix-associated actin-dependent regulator of chromatin subfamily B protein 1
MNPAANIPMNGINMAMNPGSNMNMNSAMSMNQHNMGMNMNMNNINPSFLAAFQNAQNSQNGMMAKYPNYQGSIPPSTPNLASTQGHGQSISPSQLITASPSQLMGGPSQQSHPQGPTLTLTPAQLLQQQQSGMNQPSVNMGTMHPTMGGMNMNMGGGAVQNVNMVNAMPNISGGAMNMGGSMQNMTGNTIQNMGMSNIMSGMPNLSNPQMRVGMTPQRWAQMSQHDRIMFQQWQQQQQLGLGQAPGTPSQQHHERGPSLTHDRPPSQLGRRDRASSQSHDRQPSQQPQDLSQINDRPSSSASIRSHHSHHNVDSGLMPPPSSRPGTSSGVMGAPNVNPRMNSQSMNLNPHLNMTTSANINPHMNQASHIPPAMHTHQVQQTMNMNMGLPPQNITPAMNQVQNPNPHMNRPPTRTDSSHGLTASPRQSPRMSGMMNLAGGPPGGMSGNMGGQVTLGMSAMSASTMGMHNAAMGGVPGGGNIGMNIGGGMSAGMGTTGNAGVGGMGNVPLINNMGNLGPVNMGANTVGGLGAGGSLLGGAGGGLMGPPVIPQSLQRPDREQMMQRDRSASVHGREQVSSAHQSSLTILTWQRSCDL